MDLSYTRDLKSKVTETSLKWNKLEKAMKQFQQGTQAYPVATVNELRYAGRILVEITPLLLNEEDVSIDIQNDIVEKLIVACQYVENALHDLIDQLFKMTNDIDDEFLKIYGYDFALVDYTSQKEQFNQIKQEISNSREDRANRGTIYGRILQDDFSFLMGFRKYLIANTVSGIEQNENYKNEIKRQSYRVTFVVSLLAGLVTLLVPKLFSYLYEILTTL